MSSRSMSRVIAAAGLLAALGSASPASAAEPLPIIDMHLHALHADDQGPPPVVVCAPYDDMPVRDSRLDAEASAAAIFKAPPTCAHPLWSARTDDELRKGSLGELRRLNVTAVTSGPADVVERWRKEAPDRIIPGIMFDVTHPPSLEELRRLHAEGRLAVLGELSPQYQGIGPDDPRLEPYWKLAEELDIPVGLHVGPGPPGASEIGLTDYRMRLSDPLLLDDVLARHPHLRLYVMHAGWPNADRMIGLLYAHPQVYVDVAVIDFTQPRSEFHGYLRRLVDAGYGKRIMFGSDQMVWPGAIERAIDAVTSADYLTAAQKRDILHDNAARFLRLEADAAVTTLR